MQKPVLWHGYPQAPDAHPERPWWTRSEVGAQKGWERPGAGFLPDGLPMLLAQYDEEHPLPPPPPKCQQVWVKANSEKTITRVEVGPREIVGRKGETKRAYVWAGTECYARDWPPEGYVLAYGPLSPWAPSAKEDVAKEGDAPYNKAAPSEQENKGDLG